MTQRAFNSAIYDKFYVGTTGLVSGNFTINLEVDGASSAQAVTVAEDALGWYEYNFTPNVSGEWNIKITYSSIGYTNSWTVMMTAASEHMSNQIVRQRFYIGTTGLIQANFTTLLEKNNLATAVSLTITQDSGGWYDVSFTPTSAGDWFARIDYQDNHIGISAFIADTTGTETVINEPFYLSVVEETFYLTLQEESFTMVIT